MISCPSWKHFFTTMNRMKALAYFSNIPSVVVIFINLYQEDIREQCMAHVRLMYAIFIIYCLRLARLFYFFRIARYYRPLAVLIMSMRASIKELSLLFLLMIFGMVVFGNLIYFVEIDGNIPSVPYGCWWALITMTTVGYGDATPISTLGYILGGWCAIAGLIIAALPIPVITKNFEEHYACVNKLENLLKKQERQLAKKRAKALANGTVPVSSSIAIQSPDSPSAACT